ncbi:MAG: carboxypeptidase regulatory-like domain-containing protein [Deltaproteobacteria bacterium]|nr:carboxypeptidase regulatory-like domain-containing protein [Deltaproteobacteria bacterium]
MKNKKRITFFAFILFLLVAASVSLVCFLSGSDDDFLESRYHSVISGVNVKFEKGYKYPYKINVFSISGGNKINEFARIDNISFFEVLPGEPLRITVSSKEYETTTVPWVYPVEDTAVLPVKLKGITGVVRNTEGKTLSGSKIIIEEPDRLPQQYPVDENGRFFIPVKKTVKLTAYCEGYVKSPFVLVSSTEEDIEISLVRASTLKVFAYNHDGSVLKNVELRLVGEGMWPPGRYTIDSVDGLDLKNLGEGYYTLMGFNDELTAEMDGVYLESGKTTVVHMYLKKGVVLKFLVRDRKTGDPIPDATLSIAREQPSLHTHNLETDDDGYVTTPPITGGTARFSISAPGYVNLTGRRYWVSPNERFAIFEMDRGLTLKGTVVDDKGFAVENAIVEVHGTDDSGNMITPLGLGGGEWTPAGDLGVTERKTTIGLMSDGAVITDSSGNFTLTGVPSGVLGLKARHQDFSSGMKYLGYTRENRRNIRLVLKKGQLLTGYVVDKQGIPVKGVEIRLESWTDPDFSFTVYADSKGEFRVNGCPSNIFVTYRHRKYSSLTEVIRPSLEHKVVLQRAENSFEISLRDKHGFPLKKGVVHLESLIRPERYIFLTDSRGTAKVGNVGECPYIIHVIHRNFPDYSFRLEKCENKTIEVPYGGGIKLFVRDLKTRGTLSGRIDGVSKTGSEFHGKFVNGDFSTGKLKGEKWFFTIKSKTYRTVELEVDIPSGTSPGEVTHGEILVELDKSGIVSGNVVDQKGFPVKFAVVSAAGSRTYTDHSGNYTLRDLPDGNIAVHVWHSTSGYDSKQVNISSMQNNSGENFRLSAVNSFREKLKFRKEGGSLFLSDPLPSGAKGLISDMAQIISVNGLDSSVPIPLITAVTSNGHNRIYLRFKNESGIEKIIFLKLK